MWNKIGYGAAKAGLLQLTRTLAIAWAGDNIRPNAMIARTTLARVGQPHDIAGAVLFLSSPAAAYITGQALPVEGGYSIRG